MNTGTSSPTCGANGGRKCGTHLGYDRHHAVGEEACQPCKDAHAAYTTGTRNRDYDAKYQRARRRALAILAGRHQGVYAALLAEHGRLHLARTLLSRRYRSEYAALLTEQRAAEGISALPVKEAAA